jgi:hypothetical protein
MATIEPAADTPAPVQLEPVPKNIATTDESELSPFERLCARLKGTVVIHGDIVNSDPEGWDCEGE